VDVYDRLEHAGGPILREGATTCCYHQSEKAWIDDPSGVSCKTFMTTGESATFGQYIGEDAGGNAGKKNACCG